MALGPLTIDGVPMEQLYNVFRDDLSLHQQDMSRFKGLFCGADTIKSTVTVRHAGLTMRRRGGEGTNAALQYLPRYEVPLMYPVAYEVAAAITQDAWERGMDASEVALHGQGILAADAEIVTKAIINSLFADGGWYDGTLAPPTWGSNTFDATHDHYLTYAASSMPTVEIMAEAKRHLTHHGYGSNLVAWINGDSATELEKDAAPVNEATMNLPWIQDLQVMGFLTGFQMAGVPLLANEWVPPGYMSVQAFPGGERPMRWRITEQPATANLIMFENPAATECTHWQGAAHRWVGGPTVVVPGCGVAVQLNSANDADAYVDPQVLDFSVL